MFISLNRTLAGRVSTERAEYLLNSPSMSFIASCTIHPIDIPPSILRVNTFVHSRAVIQGVSIRTGLDKRPVYMAIKLLWLKPDKHYVTRKGSHLTSTQSCITGLYSVRYSPLHIINSCRHPFIHYHHDKFRGKSR